MFQRLHGGVGRAAVRAEASSAQQAAGAALTSAALAALRLESSSSSSSSREPTEASEAAPAPAPPVAAAAAAAAAPQPPQRSGTPWDAMNELVARMLSDLTAGMRFPGALNLDLNEIATTLVPFPRMHFLSTG